MVSRALLILGPLWIHSLIQACRGEELTREAVLSWFRERVLGGLGLEEPPAVAVEGPDVNAAQAGARHMHRRTSRTTSDSVPEETTESHFTYYFQPSMNNQETLVTSAHFWFYTGEGSTANTSAPLFILTSAQQLLQAAEAPSKMSSDGWTTYHLDQSLLASVAEGPFLLQVRCPTCQCHGNEADKMPFLHLHAQPRGPVRSPRHAPVTIPWSPSVIDLLQRPSQERPQHSDCHRAEIEISFEELGWDNWIVHPTALTFYYCHGNCSAWDRTSTMLGITQCCAPVPGTMKSLRITTTSDGGYSFKYETLPNIIPEECTCI
ncbi:inhibin alpha chain [Lates japonicus]|uniref:Inhibin alpha chain n=1 Tax=Lates japonicus TaxID=270547 RepID=A0AAD3RBY1_LATJO|nr:inhibin alpha chain [Lates japonicus]